MSSFFERSSFPDFNNASSDVSELEATKIDGTGSVLLLASVFFSLELNTIVCWLGGIQRSSDDLAFSFEGREPVRVSSMDCESSAIASVGNSGGASGVIISAAAALDGGRLDLAGLTATSDDRLLFRPIAKAIRIPTTSKIKPFEIPCLPGAAAGSAAAF